MFLSSLRLTLHSARRVQKAQTGPQTTLINAEEKVKVSEEATKPSLTSHVHVSKSLRDVHSPLPIKEVVALVNVCTVCDAALPSRLPLEGGGQSRVEHPSRGLADISSANPTPSYGVFARLQHRTILMIYIIQLCINHQ